MKRREFLQGVLSLGAATLLPGSVPLSAAVLTAPATVPVATPSMPILEAAIGKRWDIVKQWLAIDPSLIAIREGKHNDRTLLHLAMGTAAWDETEDGLKLTQYLVEHGCDVNAKDHFGATPLLFANSLYTNTKIIKYLVAHGAEVNVMTKWFRKTPLYYAITVRDDFENIKFLVSHGADVNEKYSGGATPLHFATHFLGANVEFVKYLVSQGADVHTKNDNGNTALDQAKKRGHTAIVEYLASVT